jgi:hypothetical protein
MNCQPRERPFDVMLACGTARFHGGLSTGPKTPDGKRRSLEAMRAGYRAWLDKKSAAFDLSCFHP